MQTVFEKSFGTAKNGAQNRHYDMDGAEKTLSARNKRITQYCQILASTARSFAESDPTKIASDPSDGVSGRDFS